MSNQGGWSEERGLTIDNAIQGSESSKKGQ